MAELVIGAFTMASSAISGLMGIGGTAAAATGTAAGLGSLGSGFSAMSSLASFGSGVLGLFQGLANADGQRFQAAAERVAGEEAVADLMEARNRTMANNMVAAAASGVDTSVGDPAQAMDQAAEDANAQISVARSNAAMRAYLRRQQARQAEIGGIASFVGGVGGAAKEMASSRLATERRGA